MAENNNTTPETAVTIPVTEEKSGASANPEKLEEDQKPAAAEQMEEAKKIPIMKLIMIPLTIFSFLLSLPILSSIIWLLYMRHCDCEDLLQLPKLQLGIVVVLIIVFLASNLVVYFRSKFPIPGTIIVMVPLIVMLTVGLALVGAYRTESRDIPGSPAWLRMKVNTNINWNNIKSCIYDTRICDDLITRSFMVKPYDFTNSKLTPIESGCCIPPPSCDMEYVNATYWRKGQVVADGLSDAPYDIDCDLWTNDETNLCYNCHACKEGFISTIRGKWTKLGTFLIVMSLFLIVAHLLTFVATMCEIHARY